LVKVIPEPSATRNAMFNVTRSNTKTAITPPRMARLRHRRYIANVRGQRSKVKVTASSNVSAAKTL